MDERVAVVVHVDGCVDEDSVLHAAVARRRRGRVGLEATSVVSGRCCVIDLHCLPLTVCLVFFNFYLYFSFFFLLFLFASNLLLRSVSRDFYCVDGIAQP